MKNLKWIFLFLYVLVLIGLFGFAYSAEVPSWLQIFYGLKGNLFWTVFVIAVMLLSQACFLFGTGKVDVQRPKNKYLVLVPIVFGALFMAALVYAAIVCAGEFIAGKPELGVLGDLPALWIIIIISWIAWGIIFYRRMKDLNRQELYKKLLSTIIAGSLIEFIPAVVMHMIASRRQGCFAGMFTGVGVSAGLVVMLWSFGPAIIFLFIREKQRLDAEKNGGTR